MKGPEARPSTRVPKASDVLANTLKVRILSEGLRAGERLPSEAQLIEEYQFSRGTVREALRMLESDGLVRVRRGPHGGIEVASPDASRVTRSLAVLFAFDRTPMLDLVDFRLVVEPGAAAMAARDATLEQRQKLLDTVKSEANDTVQHSLQFHRELGVATNNGFMRTILTALHAVLEWQTKPQILSDYDQAESGAAHLAIAKAVSAGHATKAERLMREHLEQFRQVLEREGRLDDPIVPRPDADSAIQMPSSAWY